MKQHSDEELAKEVQRGDVDSFGTLVERYEQKLLRYARRFLFGYEDAEDMVQGVFLKAFMNIHSFDTGRSFSSWIYRIAHNEFINAIKKRKTEPLSLFDFDTFFPRLRSDSDPQEELEKKELKEQIEKHLGEIPLKYREPLILYYIEELSYKEISDIMKLPTSTVGVRIRRAKALLQKSIESNSTK